MPQDLERKKAYGKAYYQAHKKRYQAWSRAYHQAHKDVRQEQIWRAGRKVKLEALIHYSGNPPKCAYCGEGDIDVLCLDHINNDGAEQRKKQGLGRKLHYWLRREGYPEGFQILCANCNLRKELQYRRTKWKR